jgi:hypothetical protein
MAFLLLEEVMNVSTIRHVGAPQDGLACHQSSARSVFVFGVPTHAGQGMVHDALQSDNDHGQPCLFFGILTANREIQAQPITQIMPAHVSSGK